MEEPDGAGLVVQIGQVGNWNLPVELLEMCARRTVARAGEVSGEISVTFLTDEEIRALNREYLGKDDPTDVIAFALHEAGTPILGDVYIGYEQAVRQALDLGVELPEELLRLTIHGTLHVLGHEHPEGEDRARSEMYRLQEEILGEVLAAGSPPG